MKKTATILLLSVIMIACSTVPMTDRKQLNLLPESQMVGMAATSYSQFLSENQVVDYNDPRSIQVRVVGTKIANAAKTYLKQHGMLGRVAGFDWEFKLVNSPEKNAWCMPGGKVVFYTGILDVTQNDAGLAVVMGHEIAHAIARHGNERMSQGLAVQLGGVGLGVAMSQQSAATQNIFLQSYGVGSTLGMLKYSRVHESEADHMGLVFMAMAGYNPEEAPKFWQRMAAGGGQAPPEFMSTHPSHSTRVSNLNKWMAEAKKYYKPS